MDGKERVLAHLFPSITSAAASCAFRQDAIDSFFLVSDELLRFLRQFRLQPVEVGPHGQAFFHQLYQGVADVLVGVQFQNSRT